MKAKRLISAAVVCVLTFGCVCVPTPAEVKKPVIYIAGDSTSCTYGYDEKYVVPRAGWGMYIDEYLNDRVEVEDCAKSGRSSKSFAAEDNYIDMMNSISEGDYLFIQFGHNDQKNKSDEDKQTRYTSPEGGIATEGSFKNSLYVNYIKPAQEKGAKPVLLTPIPRYKFNDDGTVNDSHGEYDDDIIALAKELNIPCLDVNKALSAIYDNNAEAVSILHAIYADNTKGTNGMDTTHLNHLGGRVAACVVAACMLDDEELAGYVATDNNNLMSVAPIYSITRAEFVDSLMRIAGESDEEGGFDDVEGEELSKTLAAAQRLNIARGDGNGNFMPNRELTEDEFKAFTQRFCEAEKLDYNELAAGLDRKTTTENAYKLFSILYSQINGESDAENQSDDQIEKVE